MLRTLKIKNFALIADQTINFKKGFNVLIGETGAGKSLILDSLGFVLGDKANKINIRYGESKMFVQAVFDCSNKNIIEILNENDIEVEDSIIFSRTLTSDSKSECRINGVIVPLAIVKKIALHLVDTYTQNENIELLKVKNQLLILDSYGEEKIKKLKDELLSVYSELTNIRQQKLIFGGSAENRDREIELLDYQIKDIESMNFTNEEEDIEIKNKISILENSEKIFDSVKNAQQALNIVSENLYNSESQLNFALKYDESLISLKERINTTKIEVEDILESLNDYISKIDYNTNDLDSLSDRYEKIRAIKKKYGNSIQDVLKYLNKIKNDYDDLLMGEEKLLKLEQKESNILKDLAIKAENLSVARKEISKAIENSVLSELELLGFKNIDFKIMFNKQDQITKEGFDDVEFLLSANKGEQLKSLSKTISGGEMSRFMLALKNVFAKCFNSSTLVFDEVDTGISGEIAQKVAERLANLSKDFQLICITHLCQSTAMADNYYNVAKMVENGKTFTLIKELNNEEIISYIATISGATPTQVAINFAKELKQKANEYKRKINN